MSEGLFEGHYESSRAIRMSLVLIYWAGNPRESNLRITWILYSVFIMIQERTWRPDINLCIQVKGDGWSNS